MYMTNFKKHVGFLNRHNGHDKNKKEQICAIIGIDTPLFPFVRMLIKMNYINMKQGDK